MKASLTAVTATAGIGAALLVAGLALWPRPTAEPGGTPVAPSALLTELRAAFEDRQRPPLSGSWRLSLPEDHAAHPDANAETWSLVLHLQMPDGTPVPALLSLSRFGAAPGSSETDTPWTPHTAWLGQAALAIAEPRAEERLSRGVGAAGAEPASGEVWLDDWRLQHPVAAGQDAHTLQARVEGDPLDLALTPVKPPVSPGEATEGPARGFAMSRLEVSGWLGHAETEVSGVAWLDRLWGDLPTPGGPLVYDRMIVHLDDGSELSLLRTRRGDGRGSATLDGVLVDAEGQPTALAQGTALTEGDGPGVWRLDAPGLALRAVELPGSGLRDFAVPVRHAGLRVEGTRAGAPVAGIGTLLLSPEAAP